jgi:hypothetical protein
MTTALPWRAIEGVAAWDGRPCLRVRVPSPPVEGAANDALIAFLAKALDLPRSGVTLIAGDRARLKRLRSCRGSATPVRRPSSNPGSAAFSPLDRVIPFGHDEARVWGVLSARTSKPGSDNQIAATALVRGAVLATRNVRHFSSSGVSLVNPYDFNLD